MAKILVISDDEQVSAEIHLIIDEYGDEWIEGVCDRCGETLTDRGQFADTLEATSIHVDYCKGK